MSALENDTVSELAAGDASLGATIQPPDEDPPRRRRVRPAWYGVLALAVLTAYFTLSGSSYLYTFNLCLLAVFGAIALDFLKGTGGMISTGNAAFMAVGAFTSVYVRHVGLPFPVDVICGAVAAGVAGLIIGSPAVRLRGLQLFLATMAGHFLIVHFAFVYQQHSGNTAGFISSPLFFSKGLDGGQIYWAWMLFALVSLLILGATRLVRERSGRALRMIRDHEIVAHTMGIRVTRYKMLAFVLSSAVIGFEGGLFAQFTGAVNSENFTFQLAITYVVMVVIGGLDSVAGACIGAATVTALPVIIPKVLDGILGPEQAAAKGPAFSTITYGVLVILFITSSPNGMVGMVRRIRGQLVGLYAGRRASA
ncbi:MAG: hypothetical protein JWO68_3384 [Actinomycetia bacterium]|nr:hypothetical protein [Actinomycetes bacterium]